jgi:glycosyltransferase involved in cell wall biosynthesis
MISVIIPSYRNPKCLDICLESVLKTQSDINEIIVVLDGYVEESSHIIEKYKDKIHFLPLSQNMGMQYALNIGVYNASNEWVLIVNDDNVFPMGWNNILLQDKTDKLIISPNQIEKSPSIFDFITKDFGDINNFKLDEYLEVEPQFRKEKLTENGEIFPFFMQKKYYMVVGGFDTWYPSPFICDWDFFLKLEIIGLKFLRSQKLAFYHFGSMATKKGNEKEKFTQSEQTAAEMFEYKWGFKPIRYQNNSHKPKNINIKGIKYE